MVRHPRLPPDRALPNLRAFAPYLRTAHDEETKRGLRVVRKVVNISSTSGVNGNAGQINYSSAKAAIMGMTQDDGQGVGPLSVTVNAVAFGYVQTRLTKPLARGRGRDHRGPGPQGQGRGAGLAHRRAEPDDPTRARRHPEEAAGAIYLF